VTNRINGGITEWLSEKILTLACYAIILVSDFPLSYVVISS